MFKLCRQSVILRHNSPSIAFPLRHGIRQFTNHGFHGENHTTLQFQSCIIPHVRYTGWNVKIGANTVSAVLRDGRITVPFGRFLTDTANFRQARSGSNRDCCRRATSGPRSSRRIHAWNLPAAAPVFLIVSVHSPAGAGAKPEKKPAVGPQPSEPAFQPRPQASRGALPV